MNIYRYKYLLYGKNHMTLIICHRGINRRDENTFSSITGVNSLGGISNIRYGVEFDIQITRDNSIVCYHDETLERLHKLPMKVDSLVRDDIETLGIPLFEDVMLGLDTQHIFVNVEFKMFSVSLERIDTMCKAVIDICTKLDILDKCIFTSFDSNIVEYILTHSQIDTGLILYNEYDPLLIDKLSHLGMKSIVVNKELAISNPEHIFHRFKTYLYTFFDIDSTSTIDKDTILSLIQSNLIHLCAGFITDDHNMLRQLMFGDMM